MAVPPAVKAIGGRWDPCASGTCCGLVLWSPICILLGCVWETDGELSPVWEEQGTVLCWSPGGVRDLAYSSRLHLLTTSLLQVTPFLRFICRAPPEVTCRLSVTHLGFRVTWCGYPSRWGRASWRPTAAPSLKPCVLSVSSGSDPAAFLLCLVEC